MALRPGVVNLVEIRSGGGRGAGASGVVTPTDDEFIKLDRFEKQRGADAFIKEKSLGAGTGAEKQWPKIEGGQAGIQELAGNATLLYYLTDEAQEGKNAFLEKRKPDFKGK